MARAPPCRGGSRAFKSRTVRMPYKDKQKRLEYQKSWIAKRRADFFEDKLCADCGGSERLELDHIDPSQKISHRIWSWSEERRAPEIAKCQILCRPCHVKKMAANGECQRGEDRPNSKYTTEQVLEVKRLRKQGWSYVAIEAKTGITKSAARGLALRKWKHLDHLV